MYRYSIRNTIFFILLALIFGDKDCLSEVTFFETVEIKSIVISANVYDKKGFPLLYLKKDNFRLTENSVEQEIDFFVRSDKTPVRVIFLLDSSGSMGLGDKMRFSKRAIEVAVSMLRLSDSYALYTFTDKDIVIKIEETSDKFILEKILNEIRPWGRTAIFDSIQQLTDIITLDRESGKIAIILFTDGIDNASVLNKNEVLNNFRKIAVPIYIIAFDTFASRRTSPHYVDAGLSTRILEYFSDQTGGTAYILDDPSRAPGVIGGIYKKLRNQYLIGWTTNTSYKEGEYVKINLIVDKKNTKIKTRKGYIYQ